MRKNFLIISLVLLAGTSLAATVEPAAKDAADKSDSRPLGEGSKVQGAQVQKVTVTAERQSDTDQRRVATAAKMIFGREELDRNGDSTVGEILKRLPGVTLGGRPGRGGDVRMRGLGSGYTQILLNGERAPRGFSLESLSPDQVERIEVMRGPVAEFSTQAIAGTINIVLREGYKQPQTTWRIIDTVGLGQHAPELSVTKSGDVGALAYTLSGNVRQDIDKDETATRQKSFDAAERLIGDRKSVEHGRSRSARVMLSPRFNYRFDDGDTLTFQSFLMSSRGSSEGSGTLDETVTVAPYVSVATGGDSTGGVVRGSLNWQQKLEDGARLNLKLGLSMFNNESDSLRRQFDAANRVVDTFSDSSATDDSSASAGGKYSTVIGEAHTLATGWDAEWGQRTQSRTSLQNGLVRFADSGEDLKAQTRRLSGFLQDEWDVSKAWSAYLGLRWEGIRTRSDAATGALTNTSSVWSPILHSVWRIPGGGRDQVRASLTQSYRAPSLADLIALPSFSRLNSPTSPDRIGNPALNPELASGVDVAFEHYLSRSGIVSANVFRRGIRDLMRRELVLRSDPFAPDAAVGPRWVSRPINIGKATTSGVELEAKFQLAEYLADAPAVDIRANYSRFWSTVDAVPGPNNRLEQQPRQTGNFGLDYRPAGTSLTLGGSLNLTPAYDVRSSETQSSHAGVKRQFDAYGLWKIDPTMQLRLSVNNLLADDYLSGSRFDTAALRQISSTTQQTFTLWSLQLELKI